MAFTDSTKFSASLRQSKWDGWGSWCARCGTPLAGKKPEATQRAPGSDWSVDNCVILCTDCFAKIGKHKDLLTDEQIPYFQRYPDMWHGDTSYVIKVGQTSSGVKL